jgi:hypothetical protein
MQCEARRRRPRRKHDVRRNRIGEASEMRGESRRGDRQRQLKIGRNEGAKGQQCKGCAALPLPARRFTVPQLLRHRAHKRNAQ